jgi:hypothetical protein
MWESDDNEIAFKKVIGATVKEIAAKKDFVGLVLDTGQTLRLSLDGDCCSRSYFTDTDQFLELVGAKIQGIEERRGESKDGLNEAAMADEYAPEDIKWYFLVFVTNKGHVTIDWRNDSNGYYSGSITASLQGP